MADETKPDENEVPADDSPKQGGKTGLVVGFVGAIVLLETALFFFMVPSAEQVSALAEQQLIQSVQEGAEEALEEASDENKEIEFQLGSFGETFTPAGTQQSYRVEIRLYGLIRNKNQDLMNEEFADKEGRIRHAIRMKIRNSDLEELQDNQLGLLQRMILTTCNHLLSEDMLLGIGFHDYQLIPE